MTAAGWLGRLELAYRRDDRGGVARTIAHDRHEGPLRVLQPLYPEGAAICHHVIVHPPGGIVGGDTLQIDVRLEAGAQALITTPGATRFYRSAGATATQHVQLALGASARLEWLPLETIAYSGCRGDNRVLAELAPGAEMIGWDLLVLGLDASGEPFADGCFRQELSLAGRWIERGRIDAGDRVLLDSVAGCDGRRVLATVWFASGTDLDAARRQDLLDTAREALGAAGDAEVAAGATSPNGCIVVVRALARRLERARDLLASVRAAWRRTAWDLDAAPPRIWRT